MKKAVTIFSLTIIIAVLSYTTSWLNYILLLIIAIAIIFLIIIGLISIFRKLNNKIIQIPLIIICVCILGVVSSLFRPYEDAIRKSENMSENLKYAYITDQNDRKELKSFIGYFSQLSIRDSIRLNQVKKNYSRGEISKPMDKFYAASVFHHSGNSKDYEIASRLASEAASAEKLKGNYKVQWLKKASYDRWMLSIGKQEKYNTQNKFSIDLE